MRKVSADFSGDSPYALSSVHTTVHVGAHTDAPLHINPKGCGIGERSLHFYFGSCQVLSVDCPIATRITLAHLKEQKILAPRVLFKTRSFPNPNQWTDHFNSLSVELVSYLFSQQVILVGIDTPSIDPAQDKTLAAHKEVYKNNMAILEGIVLDHVEEGLYSLVALPLKMMGADASPVRAILVRS
jgi:arylformamidase